MIVGAGRRRGGHGRDQAGHPTLQPKGLSSGLSSAILNWSPAGSPAPRALIAVTGAQRPRLDLPVIPLGHSGVPETSLRAQRPRCPLWAQHSCKTHSQEMSALGTTTHRHPVSVLKCGNLSTLYHLPPHPPGLGIVPPLPTPFRLTADTREYGPSSFWGSTPP